MPISVHIHGLSLGDRFERDQNSLPHPNNRDRQYHDKGSLLGLISLLLETNSPRLNRSGA